ncbi:hypothetical protein BN3662_01248 [Clostridiales bacterium CHKCI006]|nr:hypothetical protein BN3662_01248 [Clostridiales bacterium CHKCI006]
MKSPVFRRRKNSSGKHKRRENVKNIEVKTARGLHMIKMFLDSQGVKNRRKGNITQKLLRGRLLNEQRLSFLRSFFLFTLSIHFFDFFLIVSNGIINTAGNEIIDIT